MPRTCSVTTEDEGLESLSLVADRYRNEAEAFPNELVDFHSQSLQSCKVMILFVQDKSRRKSNETPFPLSGELEQIFGNYLGVFPLQIPIVTTRVKLGSNTN